MSILSSKSPDQGERISANNGYRQHHPQNNNNSSLSTAMTWKYKILLGLLNFTTLNRARPGIFVAPYLLMSGWNESMIGWLFFFNCILSLIIQTPAGIFADLTSYKRTMIGFSNLLIAVVCYLLIFYSHLFSVIMLSLGLLGIGYTIAYPAVYSMTLGLVGSEGIMEQVTINETCIHAGNAFFAIISGFVVYSMDEGDTIFYICIGMALLTIIILSFFDPNLISTDRARGITTSTINSSSTSDDSSSSSCCCCCCCCSTSPSPSSNNNSQPIPFTQLIFNKKVIIFYISIMFFHLSNASMLPLLAQILYVKGDHGFEFSCLCVAVAQLTMILSASFAGYYVHSIGTKHLFLLAFVFLPLRGITLMILLWDPNPDPFILVSTQILDGAAGGLFGVIAVLIAENLSRGTGHFSVMVGTIKTVESLGAAFSSLCGEQLAEVVNYSVAFGVLSLIAILPILIYGCFMPSGKRDVFTGEMIELLSILPNQHPSSSLASSTSCPSSSSLSYDDDQNRLDESISSSVDIDSSRTRLSLSYERYQQQHSQHSQRQIPSSCDEENQNPINHRRSNGHTTTHHIQDNLYEM